VTNGRFYLDLRWAALLADLGVDVADVLRRAGLPRHMFTGPSPSVTTDEFFALWESLSAELHAESLPVCTAQNLSAEVVDVARFAALCAADLNSAARRLQQFKPLIGPIRIELDINEDFTEIRPDWRATGEPPTHLALSELLFWVALVRMGTRTRTVPLEVIGPSAERQVPIEGYLGVQVRAGSPHRIRFSASDARQPFLTVSDSMWESLQPGLRQGLARLDSPSTTEERVRVALVELLPSGDASIKAVARNLAVSSRTLQRRLHDESTSFQSILAATRHELAVHYLSDGEIPVDQIAFLLGYAEPSSFRRAFHEWTGRTPCHARRANS
jgi:AraC-like DNA-binding protein